MQNSAIISYDVSQVDLIIDYRAEATKRIAEMYAKKAAEEDFRPLSETH
jgi:hypothetical protein